MKSLLTTIVFLLIPIPAFGQVTLSIGVQILKAEDYRRYSPELQNLMYHASPAVRARAALAAGRIGNEAAIGTLEKLLETDSSVEVQAMSAFALGEIESVKASAALLRVLGNSQTSGLTRARAVEAIGKIAAANASDSGNKMLGAAILETLDKRAGESNVALLAITAALRARPEGADRVVSRFLSSPHARIRADAANTLSRLRAKNANAELRQMVASDGDPIARANAARALGAAEDKDALTVLNSSAVNDPDSRVRVSAIRSLGTLKDQRAVEPLIAHGEKLVGRSSDSHGGISPEQNELIEIAAVLARLLANTKNSRASALLEHAIEGNPDSSELALALFRIDPEKIGVSGDAANNVRRVLIAAQLLGELSAIDSSSAEVKDMKEKAPVALRTMFDKFSGKAGMMVPAFVQASPDILQAYARFETRDLKTLALKALTHEDIYIRAAAAGVLDDLPSDAATVTALKAAYTRSLQTDKDSNDGQLAILSALVKLDKAAAEPSLREAFSYPDLIVRRQAADLIKLNGLSAKFPDADKTVYPIWLHNPRNATRSGQVLNRDVDYRRALARKNGSVRAVLTTEKGTFTIEFLPEDAPLTVDNFVKLARARYFDGLEVHRVVPNFVMQDGDPRGDGNGGPGWSIRCEVNMLPYDRGAVGMALSGKDTGGSQWFVTHSPQPHLDGGYTVFGRVKEKDMAVVDQIVKGDKILTIRIIEGRVSRN
jgi:cyclophilin family peptidyl-prolyl cis-trans isomerase/HEAT repeat protein